MSPTKGITFLYALAVIELACNVQIQLAVPHKPDNQEQFAYNDEARKLHEATYQNSKIFQLFSLYADTLIFTDELDDEVNDLFWPEFVRRFLKNHIRYLPLCASVMTNLRDTTQPRAKNGPIDNYFMQKKTDVRQASCKIGQFGHIKCGRDVDFASNCIDVDVKKISFANPTRARKNKIRRRSGNLTEADLLGQKESYKKTKVRKALSFGSAVVRIAVAFDFFCFSVL